MNVRVVHVCVWNFIVDVAISDLGIQTMFINELIQTAIMPQHWPLSKRMCMDLLERAYAG